MSLPIAESIAIIESLASKELMKELLYLRDQIDRDDPEDGEETYNLLDAFDDASNQVDWMVNCPKQWSMHIREIEIALGWWKIVTEEELSHTIVFSTDGKCKKYAFIRNGLKYKFHSK